MKFDIQKSSFKIEKGLMVFFFFFFGLFVRDKSGIIDNEDQDETIGLVAQFKKYWALLTSP